MSAHRQKRQICCDSNLQVDFVTSQNEVVLRFDSGSTQGVEICIARIDVVQVHDRGCVRDAA